MRLRRSRPPLPDSIRLPPRWRRNATIFAAIIGAAALIVCERTTQGPIQGGDRSRYHDRTFRVVHVVDGDTLDIDAPDADKPKTRIRLWGVDTPELARGGRPEMHFAREAREFARQTLLDKTVNVVLAPEKSRDKYGRLLAYVFRERGGRMFNEMLIEEGCAYADPRFPHPYKKQFESAEKRARKNGIGLWSGLTLEQMPPWKQRSERTADSHDHSYEPVTVPDSDDP